MANPLSPRAESTLNRLFEPTEDLDAAWKPLPDSRKASGNSDTSSLPKLPSSPFEDNIGQENCPPVATLSPSKHGPKSKNSSSQLFLIHEDNDDEPTQRHEKSPSKSRISPAKYSTSLKMSAGFSSPHKRSNMTLNDEEDEDNWDIKSNFSEDTQFSTFSAVPNADMTTFAALANNGAQNLFKSPTRKIDPSSMSQTPGGQVFMTPATSRRREVEPSIAGSPTPKRQRQSSRDGDTTSLLIDFTQPLDGMPKPTRMSPAKTEPNLLAYLNNQRNPSPRKAEPATPNSRRSVLNLLDFDLPPQPTPRSIPSITIRELESLKSSYLSEISSLKASLSGREAEVASLKKAVGDAERRVGEAQEEVREERNAREHAEKEKDGWEKKGKEVEVILNSVREEFVSADREREELLQKLEECNRLREEAEMKAAEANTRASVARSELNGSTSTKDAAIEDLVAQRVTQQIDEKMENLARELHTVYKKKHETKVATLKKTYEARSEKKTNELHQKISDLTKQNDELQAKKDATLSGEFPIAGRSADMKLIEEQKAELQEQKARIAGLTEEMQSMRQAQECLAKDLEMERVEKGELVAAVDEMLALQSEVGAPSAIEDFRKSISAQSSSIRGSTGGESKIARGLPTPRAAAPGKSRMMSNIERMGTGRM